MLKHKNTFRVTVCQNSGPIPTTQDSLDEVINPIRVGSRFDKTQEKGLVDTDETEDVRRAIARRETPAVPVYNVNYHHKELIEGITA